MFRGRNSMYRVYAYLLSTSALVAFPATIAAQTRQPPATAEETVTPDDRHDIIVTGVHDEVDTVDRTRAPIILDEPARFEHDVGSHAVNVAWALCGT